MRGYDSLQEQILDRRGFLQSAIGVVASTYIVIDKLHQPPTPMETPMLAPANPAAEPRLSLGETVTLPEPLEDDDPNDQAYLTNPLGTVLGWDISTNGIEWSKVRYGSNALWVMKSGERVTDSNKSQWQQNTKLSDSLDDYKKIYGDSAHIKWYDGGKGVTAAIEACKQNGGMDQRRPVICFKQMDEKEFHSAMDLMGQAGKTWYAVYQQEVQSAGKAGDPSAQPDFYCKVYKRMDELRKDHPYGHHVKLLKDLSGYQETVVPKDGYRWQNYDGGQKFIDRIGADVYRKKPYKAQELFKWLVDWSDTACVPAVCPEFGVDAYEIGNKTPFGNPLSENARSDVIAGLVGYMKDNGFAWTNYWNPNSPSSGSPGFAHWELDGSSQEYWVRQMAA